MVNRRKRLKKGIESLNKQKEIHLWKINNEIGRKDTTKDYWIRELDKFERAIQKKKNKLK